MTTLVEGPALTDFLADIDFPATTDDLLLAARRCGAEESIVEGLYGLPNRSFNGRWEVRRALDSGVLVA